MKKDCNVLVVGAGPGGSSAAYFLKHFDRDNNIEVELVDKLDPKRYSIYHDMCGEAIREELLEDLNPLKLDGLVEKVNSIMEYYPGDISIKTKMKGYIINREIFLKSIINQFEKSGGNYKEKRVLSIKQNKNKVKVKFGNEYNEYDYVIAADGANSSIGKSLGLVSRKKLFLQYIIKKEPEHGLLSFYYDEKYKGDYLWEFPHEDNVKIGFPFIKKEKFKPKEKILTKQSRFLSFGGVKKYSLGRILLLGDAAGQTNAITKGGIRPAMVAGKYAAKSIVVGKPDNYEKEWLKSDFSSDIFLKAFEKLKTMDNTELQSHMEPFRDGVTFLATIKSIIFYRKYLDLYKAYDLSNKIGW